MSDNGKEHVRWHPGMDDGAPEGGCRNYPLVGGGCGRGEADVVNHALAVGFALGAVFGIIGWAGLMHVISAATSQ